MKEKLFILWTNDNPITSELMVCRYAQNSINKGWWDEVTVIIWGATTKLVAENKAIQDLLKQMANDGVNVSACKTCADALGVANKITELGIDLKYWGEPLTSILKEGHKLITI